MTLGIFIATPLLALAPAALFFWLHGIRRRPVVLVAAVLWLLYAGYELAMQRRWLCTGECNIRADLLLIYPLLALLSLAAMASALRAP